jgi:F-type H+-transporting ATPase subunit c
MKNILKGTFAAVSTYLVTSPAFAQEAVAQASTGSDRGLIAISASIAIGVAVLGGSIGQGMAATSALEGIARNPGASGKIFTPMIIGLALIESLVIYALVIAFNLSGKL